MIEELNPFFAAHKICLCNRRFGPTFYRPCLDNTEHPLLGLKCIEGMIGISNSEKAYQLMGSQILAITVSDELEVLLTGIPFRAYPEQPEFFFYQRIEALGNLQTHVCHIFVPLKQVFKLISGSLDRT